ITVHVKIDIQIILAVRDPIESERGGVADPPLLDDAIHQLGVCSRVGGGIDIVVPTVVRRKGQGYGGGRAGAVNERTRSSVIRTVEDWDSGVGIVVIIKVVPVRLGNDACDLGRRQRWSRRIIRRHTVASLKIHADGGGSKRCADYKQRRQQGQ